MSRTSDHSRYRSFRSPATGHRVLYAPILSGARFAFALGVSALLGLGFAGCKPKVTNASIGLAHVRVENLSDRDWMLIVSPLHSSHAPVTTRLRAHDVCVIAVPGGDYAVDQHLLGAEGAAASRHFETHLNAKEDYRWSVATLLSPKSPGQAPPLAPH